MTFSLVGHCERTGMVGMAVSTSSICVGARCVWVEANVGAVATQHLTDPRLGQLGLDLLSRGHSAQSTLDGLVKAGAYAEYRQIGVIDCDGHSAAYTGSEVMLERRHYTGEHVAAVGNLLKTEEVAIAMGKSFEENPDLHIGERLMLALEAGKGAGGEVGGNEHSAALRVADRRSFPLVDLRVDWHDAPIVELRKLWEMYEPEMNDFMNRALHPDKAAPHPVST